MDQCLLVVTEYINVAGILIQIDFSSPGPTGLIVSHILSSSRRVLNLQDKRSLASGPRSNIQKILPLFSCEPGLNVTVTSSLLPLTFVEMTGGSSI